MKQQEEKKIIVLDGCAPATVYPESVHLAQGVHVYMIDGGSCDYLIAESEALGFAGEAVDSDRGLVVKAPLSHENAKLLRSLFPFTAPVRVLEREKTIGVGDRLGLACDGHIRVFKQYSNVIPVFAQQSIRELTLTNRTFDDVLDCVTFAVFRNNYTTGFGADGDHLKTDEEVVYALSCGYTMITLDCSDQIAGDIDALSKEQVDARYVPDPELEQMYCGKSFDIGAGMEVSFDEELFRRTVLIYGRAINHAVQIYKTRIAPQGESVADYEISIDETATPTLPAQHFFVANELTRRGVDFATIAPRFCGEFQKGVDYIGNLSQFCAELKIHAQIARYFGYKLSIHSGSDKFSIFRFVGEQTHGRFHLKTAGTSWLEAMLLVAQRDPALYRQIHAYALEVFEQASKYYHVTTDLTKIPALSSLTDEQLPDLFGQNDARQLIHITYGLILNEKNTDGSYRFRDALYRLWRAHAEQYAELLQQHIGRHVRMILCLE